MLTIAHGRASHPRAFSPRHWTEVQWRGSPVHHFISINLAGAQTIGYEPEDVAHAVHPVTSFPWGKEKRTKVASDITDMVLKYNPGLPREAVWVVFEPMPQENWGVGGTLVSDMKK